MDNPHPTHPCIYLTLSGKWSNSDCTVKRPYICEKPTSENCSNLPSSRKLKFSVMYSILKLFADAASSFCATTPEIANATKIVNHKYAIVTYICDPGYHFPDRTVLKSLHCLCQATWTLYQALFTCSGDYNCSLISLCREKLTSVGFVKSGSSLFQPLIQRHWPVHQKRPYYS